MKVSKPDFLVLNLSGIDVFVELVDEMVKGNPGSSFEVCARYLQNEIHEYSKRTHAFKSRPTVSALSASMTMKLGRLLHRRTPNLREFSGVRLNVVYIIRDGQRVLYVGSTRYDARKRLKSHQTSHSPLGTALREDPNADNWTVEMIPHADYKSAALKEKQLIAQLAPAFCRRF